ncbi:MAG: hypothetical protein KUG70_01720 [Rhodobacteraceae bacterium]|nr:hypothetical protein [Paracoccaceae bacterium]
MSDDRSSPLVFLEHQSYRRNRLADAARLLPVIGAAVLSVPLLWPGADSATVLAGEAEAVRMSKAILYIFGTWAGLIALSVVFGMAARRWGQSDGPQRSGQG